MKLYGFLAGALILFTVSCTNDKPVMETISDVQQIIEIVQEPQIHQPVYETPVYSVQQPVEEAQPIQEPPVQVVQQPVQQPVQTPPVQAAQQPVQQPIQQQPMQAPVQQPVEEPPVQQAVALPPVQLEIIQIIEELSPTPEESDYVPMIVSEEVYITTKSDIQHLIEDLNRMIRAGNYNAWLTYLSDSYRVRINSKEFIDDLKIRYPVFRTRINSSRDYFNVIVVPSRANDRVDDIEFKTETLVTAYTLDRNKNRLILYDLENIDGAWKIIN